MVGKPRGDLDEFLQGVEAKVHFVEISVQLGGRLQGGTPALYGDANDPCPKGQELLKGAGDLRICDMKFVLQLRKVGVPAFFVAQSTWAGFKVLDRASYLLPRVRDIHETLGYSIKLRNRVVEDSLHDITRLLDGDYSSPVDLERCFYLLASLPAWQPAGSPLGGDVSGFGRFGSRPCPALASLEDGIQDTCVADCKEDEDRVG